MDLRRGHELLLLLMAGGDVPPLGRGGLVRPRGDGEAALPADEGVGVGAGDDEEDEFDGGEKQREDGGPLVHRFQVSMSRAQAAAPAALLGDKDSQLGACADSTEPEDQTDDDPGARVDAGFPVALVADNELDEAPEKGHGELGNMLAVGLWTCEDDDVLQDQQPRRRRSARLFLGVKRRSPCR